MSESHQFNGKAYLVVTPKTDGSMIPEMLKKRDTQEKGVAVFTTPELAEEFQTLNRATRIFEITKRETFDDFIRDCVIIYGIKYAAIDHDPDTGEARWMPIDDILF